MPTAAKLVAGALFAALAWVASGLIVPLLPEATAVGMFAPVNAAIGFVVGWRVAGSRARTTLRGAVSYGLTAAFAMTFAALFLHSFAIMIRQSLRKLYDGPADALIGVVELMIEHGRLLAAPEVLGTLLLGGVLAGLATEWAGRRWS